MDNLKEGSSQNSPPSHLESRVEATVNGNCYSLFTKVPIRLFV